MLRGYSPVVQALLGSLFTWGMTALGAAAVFVFAQMKREFLDGSLGFAAGVMTAASFWSLLDPAITILTIQYERWAFLGAALGFAAGAAFVWAADHFILPALGLRENEDITDLIVDSERGQERSDNRPRSEYNNNILLDNNVINNNGNVRQRRGRRNSNQANNEHDQIYDPSSWPRILLLIIAITVHNIPEGLAVGVGFGAVGKTETATFESASTLALGIGIQNFPEGLAVSLPLAAFGFSKWRSFWYGQLSGMVEPMAAVLGAWLVTFMEPLLPYALSFAAGAMIYVVVDDIIPEANTHGNGKVASFGAIIGFLVMMSLDVGLG